VLLDPGRDGEHVRVEDDLLRGEVRLLEQQPVGALGDLDLALDGVGLALLVEGHHDHGRAELLQAPRLRQERVLAFLE